MDAMFYAFGDTDCYVIATMPDNASMAALTLALGATGAITGKTTVLLSPEELDVAVKKSASYRPLGK